VEDVAVLCPRFAVIRKGRLVAQTSPTEARQAIDGKVFEGRLRSEELEEIRRRNLRIIQSVLVEGKNRVRVHQPDGTAPLGFEPVAATLEDAYLLLMQEAGNGTAIAEEVPAVAAGGAA
jgi:ABC-type multidrug transport system ATPase subunit